MSNLPYASAGFHNDDNDDRNNTTNPKASPINSRITSRSILKRQQYTEIRTANEQACDEIHDLQPKNSSAKKTTNHNENPVSKSTKSSSSHELMQGNYYDRTRLISDHSTTSHRSTTDQIDIDIEDYKDRKKKHTPISTSESNRSSSPPFGDTKESIEQNVTQSVGRLLQSNRNGQDSMKKNIESSEQTHLNHDDSQRSSSRSSSSSSSSCSTDDSSTSNQHPDDKTKSTIPYQTLLNDEDEEELNEQPSQLVGESSTLLNKNLSQTYGTQSTSTERSNYISTNGYNSHGSSITTTKSSSDNSGSIRTNSGSDNDEESDEEHYNNSTASNNPLPIYSQRNDRNRPFIDSTYPFSNERNAIQSKSINPIRSEQTDNKDKPHQQVPRLKQLPPDDSNENYNQFDSISNRSTQQSNTHQTNSSSSQQNRNYSDQQQQVFTVSRNQSRQYQNRPIKKRKQTQQQDIIRTEFIPGHRGDRDVDELVMFIDGDSAVGRANETNKSRDSSKNTSLNELNSNKNISRKKSRKSTKSVSSNNENDTSVDPIPIEQVNPTPEPIETSPKKTTTEETSKLTWFEQTRDPSEDNEENPSPSIIPSANSEIVSEPFVTVTHRRRPVKERRQDNQPMSCTSRVPPAPVPSNVNEKRRMTSTGQNNHARSIPLNKSITSPVTKEEQDQNNHPVPSQSIPPSTLTSSVVNPITEPISEKAQVSPRLSSHSSSSSLSSLLKRQGKPPPVVFLNKSIDVELNDVSFGFDLDLPISDDNQKSATIEPVIDNPVESLASPLNESTQSNEMSTDKSERRQPQRTTRAPQFYFGSDIRHQHHRNYPTQQAMSQSYIDFLLQYNQQRLANYSQQIAYMNLVRAPYYPPQSQYVYVPTAYPPPATTTNESESNEENNPTSTEQVPLVYATPTGQIYYQPTMTKKSPGGPESIVTPISTVYPTAYPSQYFYPSQIQQIVPSPNAYFQPISSTTLVTERKDEDDLDNSNNSDHRTRQQSSADIMSNALHLVYSQQRRNAQTDHFNLDDLSAYLAMKWTDAVDHYMQGDSRIVLIDE